MNSTTDGKRCPYCGKFREWRFYNLSKTSLDGHQSYCRDCQRVYKQKHPSKEYKQHRKTNGVMKIWG